MNERGEAGCPIDKISRINGACLCPKVHHFEYGPIWPDKVDQPVEKRLGEGELYQIDVV